MGGGGGGKEDCTISEIGRDLRKKKSKGVSGMTETCATPKFRHLELISSISIVYDDMEELLDDCQSTPLRILPVSKGPRGKNQSSRS
jgi:hypothetical protein